MNKFEVINEIIRLYDCIESNEKERQIDLIKKANMAHDEKVDCLKEKIYNFGVEKILDDCLLSYKNPYINGDGVIDSFEDWISNAVYGLPDWMSKEDFINLFNDKLMEIYNTRCEVSLEDWKKKHEVENNE